jgi:hypothetical protein
VVTDWDTCNEFRLVTEKHGTRCTWSDLRRLRTRGRPLLLALPGGNLLAPARRRSCPHVRSVDVTVGAYVFVDALVSSIALLMWP